MPPQDLQQNYQIIQDENAKRTAMLQALMSSNQGQALDYQNQAIDQSVAEPTLQEGLSTALISALPILLGGVVGGKLGAGYGGMAGGKAGIDYEEIRRNNRLLKAKQLLGLAESATKIAEPYQKDYLEAQKEIPKFQMDLTKQDINNEAAMERTKYATDNRKIVGGEGGGLDGPADSRNIADLEKIKGVAPGTYSGMSRRDYAQATTTAGVGFRGEDRAVEPWEAVAAAKIATEAGLPGVDPARITTRAELKGVRDATAQALTVKAEERRTKKDEVAKMVVARLGPADSDQYSKLEALRLRTEKLTKRLRALGSDRFTYDSLKAIPGMEERELNEDVQQIARAAAIANNKGPLSEPDWKIYKDRYGIGVGSLVSPAEVERRLEYDLANAVDSVRSMLSTEGAKGKDVKALQEALDVRFGNADPLEVEQRLRGELKPTEEISDNDPRLPMIRMTPEGKSVSGSFVKDLMEKTHSTWREVEEKLGVKF